MLVIFGHDVIPCPLAFTKAIFLHKHFKIPATWKVLNDLCGFRNFSPFFFLFFLFFVKFLSKILVKKYELFEFQQRNKPPRVQLKLGGSNIDTILTGPEVHVRANTNQNLKIRTNCVVAYPPEFNFMEPGRNGLKRFLTVGGPESDSTK